MVLQHINRLYIFNYGAPIAVIHIDNNTKRLIVYTKFNDEELIKGMATVASLIKKYHSQKFFTIKHYTGYMGQEYIAVAYTNNPLFSPPIFGFLMRLTKRLDSVGAVTVNYVVNEAIKALNAENGKDFKVVLK